MVRGTGWLVAVALVATMFVVPAASAKHCDTKINVYGRTAIVPLPPPPYISMTAGICVRVFENAGVEEHVLPPDTSQVMVRIHGDFGGSVLSVRVILNGLGFLNQEFLAYRTFNSPGNIWSYNFQEWVPLPNGPTDGELTATMIGPGGATRTITYQTTLTTPPPPAVPPIPPAP